MNINIAWCGGGQIAKIASVHLIVDVDCTRSGPGLDLVRVTTAQYFQAPTEHAGGRLQNVIK